MDISQKNIERLTSKQLMRLECEPQTDGFDIYDIEDLFLQEDVEEVGAMELWFMIGYLSGE